MKLENLNLSALKYFIDAVELQSISLSSEKNHVSRPAVSQAITRLETWYGKYLLIHKKRRFELTSDGKLFYRKARSAYSNFNTSLLSSEPHHKMLKLGCSNSLIELIFPLIEPIIKVSDDPVIKVGRTDQLINELKEKNINIAFVVDTGQKIGLKSCKIKQGKFQLFSNSGRFEKTLITTEGRPEVDSFKRACSRQRIKYQNHVQVESWSVAQKMAQYGLGCCLVPDFMRDAKLERIKVPNWSFDYSLVALTRNSPDLNQLEESLLDLIHVKKGAVTNQ